MDVKNLFINLSNSQAGEEFVTLFENTSVKIERIVSHAQASPAGFGLRPSNWRLFTEN